MGGGRRPSALRQALAFPADRGPSGDAGAEAAEPAAAGTVSSAALFGRRRELVIVHRGQTYRLRITRTDKLILTK